MDADKINMEDLFIRKEQVKQLKLQTFQRILHRAHKKIKLTSRQKVNEPWCFFLIPEFLIGVPRYDTAACTAYIMDELIKNGFHLKYTHPNLLFISWGHYIDKSGRANFKKMYGYRIDGFGRPVKEKSKTIQNTRSFNPNIMLMKGVAPPTNEKAQKNYKEISTYKPTGNLIYSPELIKRIETRTKS